MEISVFHFTAPGAQKAGKSKSAVVFPQSLLTLNYNIHPRLVLEMTRRILLAN